jgi:hypothetical protein
VSLVAVFADRSLADRQAAVAASPHGYALAGGVVRGRLLQVVQF